MMTHALITLSIREIETALRRAFSFEVAINGVAVAPAQRLSIAETQVLHGLTNQYRTLFSRAAGRPQSVLEQQRAVGVALFNLWLGRAWRQVEALAPRDMPRTLIIDADRPDILNLPWTLLRRPGGDFLNNDPLFSVQHSPPLEEPSGWSLAPLPAPPLRVLLMVCAPEPCDPTAALLEEGALRRALASLDAELSLTSCERGSFAELEQQIAAIQPHVVHLIGRSQIGRICLACRVMRPAYETMCRACDTQLAEPEPLVAFESDAGELDWRPAAGVRRLYQASGVRCVVFNDPYQESLPHIDAAARLCHTLLAPSVPLVIAWACSLTARHAAPFAAQFYQQLALGQTVDHALAQARRAVRSGMPLPWPTPVLYTATSDTALLDPYSNASTDAHVQFAAARSPHMADQHALVGRRRELQAVAAWAQLEAVRTILIIDPSGSGQHAMADKLGAMVAEPGARLIDLLSTPSAPLSAARLLETCAAALRMDSGVTDMLFDPRQSVSERLRGLIQMLGAGGYALRFSAFEANLDPQTSRMQDPWIAAFCTELVFGGKARIIISSRVCPLEFAELPATARILELPAQSGTAWQVFLLRDPRAARRLGNVPEELSNNIVRHIEHHPAWAEQLRVALHTLPDQTLYEICGGRAAGGTSTSIALLMAWLFKQVSRAAQQALRSIAAHDGTFDLTLLALLVGAPKASVAGWVEEWTAHALMVQVNAAQWMLPALVREWLLMSMRDTERRTSHLSAAQTFCTTYLRSPQRMQGELECLLAARTQYIAAAELEGAREVTDRISAMLERWGLFDDLAQLQHELLALAPHPLPLLWIARSYAARGDTPAAEAWYHRCLAVAGEQFPRIAVEAWRALATLDRRQGDLAAARTKLGHALAAAQHSDDQAQIATTIAQLGLIVAALNRPEVGLRLVTLSALLLRQLDHPHVKRVSGWMNRLAAGLTYTPLQFVQMARYVRTEYHRNGTRNFVQAALQEA